MCKSLSRYKLKYCTGAILKELLGVWDTGDDEDDSIRELIKRSIFHKNTFYLTFNQFRAPMISRHFNSATSNIRNFFLGKSVCFPPQRFK